MKTLTPEPRRPNAIEDLSVLPVFYDLAGKTVLVAGNGDGAGWKAELLGATGAHVIVTCTAPDPELSAVLAEHADRITHLERDWTPEDFNGKTLAIGAFDAAGQDETFAASARAAGVPVNVVDRKALCDFQFGSIVNRSPVVISISTAGAAPALAQAIRTRIETLLPETLSAWAGKAKAARAKIKSLLPDAAQRKAFWRRFAEAALTRAPEEAEHVLKQPAAGTRDRRGHVTLVGAGPGASDLLTMRAVRAMQAADIILFDALVSEDVLNLARREAKRMLVGKRGHRASCRQEDINALMIGLARQGKRVVRLKSGDPMIFGRAGEEIEVLKAAGVPVDTVPGVTAAFAAAASLGVPLTHRDCAQGVKFITAHSRDGRLPELDWRACADPATTLIVYMGGRTANALADKLIAEGLEAQTPVVIMRAVSGPGEERDKTTLGALTSTEIRVDGPVLLGIGRTFAGMSASSVAQITRNAVFPVTCQAGDPKMPFDVAAQQS
ncbi:siroheme synthase CysG [Henriciella aquimarina]|uniref:siroheme synthase CysG n=1 Tax=Henriciella aquimarina TaxID=545261 RepID=UPI0009FD6D07|nr:siroheme synthase CysG [Henriciella aquimarina]